MFSWAQGQLEGPAESEQYSYIERKKILGFHVSSFHDRIMMECQCLNSDTLLSDENNGTVMVIEFIDHSG